VTDQTLSFVMTD